MAALHGALLPQRVQPCAIGAKWLKWHVCSKPFTRRRIAPLKAKAKKIIAKLKVVRLTKAADLVEQKVQETLTYFAYPATHWRQIRTNNPLERIIREIRRRTRVVGAFPDGQSALMLVAARLRHIASTQWGKRRYLMMETLLNPAKHETAA